MNRREYDISTNDEVFSTASGMEGLYTLDLKSGCSEMSTVSMNSCLSPNYTRYLEREVVALKLELAESRTNVDDYSQRYNTLQQENDSVKNKSYRLLRERDRLIDETTQLKSELDMSTSEIRKLRKERDRLRAQVQGSHERKDKREILWDKKKVLTNPKRSFVNAMTHVKRKDHV